MSSKTKAPFTRPARFACVVALAASILLIALSASASADLSFCTPGSGAGQCKRPEGLAVDPSNGHLYVADKGNNRVDVFDSTGGFLFAFGWGVADGASPELQTCTTTCFAGLIGGGAGGFFELSKIAVDPASPHDVYTFEQDRVQKFSPSGEFIVSWGGGVIGGGASGKGDLSSGSATVSNVVTTKKTFASGQEFEGTDFPAGASGQEISGAGIPTGTKIAAVGAGTITLSKPATASGAGVAITVPEGTGNIAVNEVQVLDSLSLSKVERGISFSTSDPSPSTDAVKTPLPISNNAPASGPGSVQSLLEGFSNIDPGDVAVSGPNGGPYTIEFKGRYADTDVDSLRELGSQDTPIAAITTTSQNGGGSFEICTAVSDCTAGVQGAGAGQFSVRRNQGEPIAVGAGGVYVGDSKGDGPYASRVEKFDLSGAFAGEITLPGNERVAGLAVDSGGDIYVTRGGQSVEKFDPSGTLLLTLTLKDVGPIAVDSAGRLFVFHRDAESRVITEFDPSGSILRRFGYGDIEANFGGIAAYSSPQGEVFASEIFNARVRYFSFPSAGPLVCCLGTILGNTKTTLKGGVNPEGKATTYHFDYVTEAAFKVNGFSGAASTPESAPVADFSLHNIEAAIGCTEPQVPPQESCLIPNTDYRYRLVAKNEDGKNSTEGTFKTLPPFEIVATYATDVGTDAAVLHATVNPFGIPATGYLEYVEDAAYQADIAEGHDGFTSATKVPNLDGGAPPFDFGAGEAPKAASAVLSALTPGATYHYRAVVTDPFETEFGPKRVLTVLTAPKPPSNSCPNQAFRTGASASLPDCRAYEMVSPVDKNGGDIKVLVSARGYPARLDQGAADGNSFAFSSQSAFAGAQSAPWTSQYLATRKAGESWVTEAITPLRESKSIDTAGTKFDSQYRAFAPDLSSGWLFYDSKALDACAPEGFMNLYRRDSGTGAYEALNTAKPAGPANQFGPELQGLSVDETHAVFRANAKLTTNASSVLKSNGLPVYQTYEHVKGEGCGELRLVSVLPSGKAFAGESSAGTTNVGIDGESRVNAVARAVSADGSRIFWTALSAIGEGAIYLRIDGAETVEITAAKAAHFWTAATDGSKAIYTIGQELYEAAIPGNTPTSTLIAKGVKGVVGASEDASRVYFVSTEALGGEGESGKPNLYLREAGGGIHLIATLYGGGSALPSGDLNAGFEELGFAIAQSSPVKNGVRVSADGTHLAFVSAGNLTGYDNTDAVDGLPDLEVYLYDTDADHLACVSCNPSGAWPSGRRVQPGGGESGEGEVRRVSGKLAPVTNQNFAPRSLSADGNRLFFESFEALLPRDTNGKEDVYEWQRAESQAQCDEHGAELYVPSAGGCLSLISTGQSPSDSEFADASPDGSDVFIRTASSLVVQDPGQVDVYDARINGGLPAPKVPVPSCEGEACQGPLAPPSDPTPASSAFEGAGNVSAATTARCGKGKVARKGRCVAKKGRKHAKQAKHNRRAGR